MLSQFSYPIVSTDKFVETVAFYEDHFGYVSAFEMDGFVILQRQDWDDMYLAVIESAHTALPEQYRRPVKGMILNMPVHDVAGAHQEAYWEGLDIVSEPAPALCGRKHFFLEDPNGVLVDVAENVDIKTLMSQDDFEALCHVA